MVSKKDPIEAMQKQALGLADVSQGTGGPRAAIALIVIVLLCLLVGASGSLITATSVTQWYPTLEKPSWTPPNALFGPVWTALYLMMGLSAWMIWRNSAGATRRNALLLFAAQLTLNSLWSLLFFGLKSPLLGAIEIVLLWIAIAATIGVFGKISRLAAVLLVPYLIWVSYAAALNLAIWQLNR